MSTKKSKQSFIKVTPSQAKEQQEQDHDPEFQQTKDKIAPFDDFIDQLSSWKPLLHDFVKSDKMKNIYSQIKTEYKTKVTYPPAHLVFNAFEQCPVDRIKVVIVGQDPYINENEAMGLCFSVPKGTKIPPSLNNIFKSLSTDPKITNFKIPKHGDLTSWAKQGVFLLNAVLTVEAGKSNSHKAFGWEQFTDFVIKTINEKCKNVVFLLWGKPAQNKAKAVDEKKHHILKTSHPSPLSAHQGFLDAHHFSLCNEYLVSIGQTPINWNLE